MLTGPPPKFHGTRDILPSRPESTVICRACGSPEIVEGSLCRFSGEGDDLVDVR